MKLIQIWVPDPKSPYFFAEARRQARLIANSPHERKIKPSLIQYPSGSPIETRGDMDRLGWA